jgi:lipopolysaccharide transport system ATP-binding protein
VPEPGILFNGVWKKFRRGIRHDSLRDLIPSTFRRAIGRARGQAELQAQEFWAVRDVSFEVRPGEALGIIGPNGAGKSTILKLLTRILRPTRGECRIVGRAGALIEIAGGFHPDLTGRENVYLQGAIMGMRRREIARKFDEIVDFAGAAEFIDTQVKRYSTGMNARLGFAIAAHLDPDVLLIDEVLSVGDASFRAKCMERLRELFRRHVPLVLISHNLPIVQELCTRVMVVEKGIVRFDGDPARGIQQYSVTAWKDAGSEQSNSGDGIRVSGVQLLDEHDDPGAIFRSMGTMRVRVGYEALIPIRHAAIAIDIHRADGIYCAGADTVADGHDLQELAGAGHIDLVFPKLVLAPGCYLGSARILDARSGRVYDRRDRAYPFTVISDRREGGVLYLEREWSHQRSTGAPESRAYVATPRV